MKVWILKLKHEAYHIASSTCLVDYDTDQNPCCEPNDSRVATPESFCHKHARTLLFCVLWSLYLKRHFITFYWLFFVYFLCGNVYFRDSVTCYKKIIATTKHLVILEEAKKCYSWNNWKSSGQLSRCYFYFVVLLAFMKVWILKLKHEAYHIASSTCLVDYDTDQNPCCEPNDSRVATPESFCHKHARTLLFCVLWSLYLKRHFITFYWLFFVYFLCGNVYFRDSVTCYKKIIATTKHLVILSLVLLDARNISLFQTKAVWTKIKQIDTACWKFIWFKIWNINQMAKFFLVSSKLICNV